MTDLSREELRAHLSAVEAQVRAALRIIAAESKSVQQAHSALRADLSAALIRLQGEINTGNAELENKVDRAISDINSIGKTRKMTSVILGVMVLTFGVTVGLLAGGGYYILQDSRSKTAIVPSSGPIAPQSNPALAAPTMAPATSQSTAPAAGAQAARSGESSTLSTGGARDPAIQNIAPPQAPSTTTSESGFIFNSN